MSTPQVDQPLHQAASAGDHARIRALVAAGHDVNQCGTWYGAGTTPLMVAAGSHFGASLETVQLLLELGADPKIVSPQLSAAEIALGGFPFARAQDPARARLLIDAGSPVRTDGDRGTKLLACIAETGNLENVKIVLDFNAAPQAEWPDAPTSLDIEQYLKGSQSGRERDGAKLQDRNRNPWRSDIPLFQAAKSGNDACVALLLAAGARADQRDSSGDTALFHATSAAIVSRLCAAGAEPLALNFSADDALNATLRIASGSGRAPPQLDAAAELLKHGVPLMRKGGFGFCRLRSAAVNWRLDAVRFLLDQGHPACRAALRSAAWNSQCKAELDVQCIPVIELLVERGADVNAVDDFGSTALHEAAAGDGPNGPAVETLIRLGANPNVQDCAGETPLVHLYTHMFHYERAVPQLLAGGANPLIHDNDGMNAIDHARSRIQGEEPPWRIAQWNHAGKPIPMGWKHAAAPGDLEYEMLELLERAAEKFR